MRKITVLLFCALCLLACRQEMAPLVSGTVLDGGLFLGEYTVAEKDKKPRSWPLSKGQLDKLSSWFKVHQSDWHMVLASPPPPSYSVLLSHSDGMHTKIDLFSINESWQRAVHIYSRDQNGKFTFGGSLSLSTEEIASLKQLLAEEQ